MSALGNKNIFRKNLKYFMSENNIDRNKLCEDLHFKYSTVSEWLSAKKYPRIDKIEMLANYFNINKSDLIEDKTSIEIPHQELINKYEQLNESGQAKLMERLDELLEVPKYINK